MAIQHGEYDSYFGHVEYGVDTDTGITVYSNCTPRKSKPVELSQSEMQALEWLFDVTFDGIAFIFTSIGHLFRPVFRRDRDLY